ncbi:MAG: hypothetical protein LBN95_13845 [Prevotellaceae bacterium]|jgi:hypothetical protein|nr:hypothetical protein [Prevotellaceae bacterium]
MAKVILEYNPKNATAQKTLQYVLSLGVFAQKERLNGLDEAILDVQHGRIHRAKNTKELFKNVVKSTAKA